MRPIACALALLATVVFLGATQSWQPSLAEMVALKHLALEHGPAIHYIAKPPSQMPSFDRIVFYPGDADPGWIWLNRSESTSPMHRRALNNALILAAMDSGVAGKRWKHYYDALEARDRDQPRDAADPYRYRQAFLRELDTRLSALAPPFPPASDEASVDKEASSFSDHDLSLLIRGVFVTPVTAKAGRLPAGMLARYDGRLGLGNYVIENSQLIDDYVFYTDQVPPGSEDAVLGAYFQAVVDSGGAGPALKERYDRAADKSAFGLALAKAYDLENERTEARSRAEIAWMQTSLRPGMSSKAVDALLRTRHLALTYGHQSGSIELPMRSSLVCGTSITVIVRFDRRWRVRDVEQQPPYTACM